MTGALRIALAAAVAVALAGCSDDTEQLRQQIAEIKARPGGRIEPLPEVKPYETFAYPDAGQRSPFEAGLPAVYSHASEYRFDTTKIIITGHSAGGHLSLTTGMLKTSDGFDRPPEWLTVGPDVPVAAIINWYGITDVADLLQGEHHQTYAEHWLGTQPNREEVARKVSPLSYVRAGLPPIVTIHGDRDELVPYSHAVRLHEALAKAKQTSDHNSGGEARRFQRPRDVGIFSEIFAFLQEQGISIPK